MTRVDQISSGDKGDARIRKQSTHGGEMRGSVSVVRCCGHAASRGRRGVDFQFCKPHPDDTMLPPYLPSKTKARELLAPQTPR
jgi:hypothetical protein